MTRETGFAKKVLASFKKILREIEKGSLEHDVRYRFVKYFAEGVLGYEPKYIKWEKKKADLTIVDENNFGVIKIETKRPSESIEKIQFKDQAFKYVEETTKFVGLTNFLRFKLWEIVKGEKKLRVNLDFSKILERKNPMKNLLGEERVQILFLNNLTKEAIFNPSKYKEFDENYAKIDITKDAGFKKLLDRLNFIVNNLLLGFTLKAFGEYKEGYAKYREEIEKLDNELKNNNNHKINHSIVKYRQKIEDQYEKYKSFHGFELWKAFSGKENLSDEKVREIFCKETIYVFLNKLLFLRTCEDKELIEKSISNGGIEELRESFAKRFGEETVNREIVDTAFKSGKRVYSTFYETGILDWFRTGNGELDKILNRVLWILNQFDFAHVDRDILGRLYEKYLPVEERKRLGEFYTPVEVIDYILTSVGYTYSYELENKDLLDPACGSGGFLVRAARRLISKYLMKFNKTNKRELRNPKNWRKIVSRLSPQEAKIILESVQEHIYGLDINPFACHIAEMNMLIQTIDLYQKVKEEFNDYKFGRFKIYRTDSLEKPSQKHLWDYQQSKFLKEQEEIDTIKNKKFDFVVGNPPYVRVQKLDKKTKEYLTKEYITPIGKFDIYIPFIERGINWLKDGAKLSYINPNLFLNREYGREVRKLLLRNTILQIIDFGDSGVFKDVTNYPCILVVQKKHPKENRVKTIIVHRPKERLLYDIQKKFYQKYYKNEYFSLFEIDQDKIGAKQWKLIPEEVLELFNKIKSSANKTLSDEAEKIYEGFITGNNKIYFLTFEKAEGLRLEKELLKPVPKGKDVKRWNFSTDQFVIYPYKDIKGKTEVIENLKSEYPNVWQYFKENENKLKKRKYLMDAIKRGGRKEWFEIWNPRSYKWFNQPKIITPNLSTENHFAFDEDGVFLDHDCYGIILKDKKRKNYLYTLGLLNSSLLEFYIKQISPYASGKYYRYMTGYLEKLPIKIPETGEEKRIAKQIVGKVNEILELNEAASVNIDELLEGRETVKLCNAPKVRFSVRDKAKLKKVNTKKNRVYINSKDFIEIKRKNHREFVKAFLESNKEKLEKSKNVKNKILNLKIPKSKKTLKKIIKETSIDQTKTKKKTKKLEKEINNLVYKIYGITKKEQKTIEENI